MNCKPGDLAVVVKIGPLTKGALGRVIRVVRLHEKAPSHLPGWVYEPQIIVDGYVIQMAEDCCLRPIRDPGDDAVDEVIQRLGTPHKEVA